MHAIITNVVSICRILQLHSLLKRRGRQPTLVMRIPERPSVHVSWTTVFVVVLRMSFVRPVYEENLELLTTEWRKEKSSKKVVKALMASSYAEDVSGLNVHARHLQKFWESFLS